MLARLTLGSLLALLFLCTPRTSLAQFTSLVDFDGAVTGGNPQGSLISDDEWIYGMTTYGGVNNMGTVFKVAHDGTGYTKLLDFDGSEKGKNPYGSLLLLDGVLYGTAVYGGTNDLGTVFKIKTDGSEFKKLWDFDGENSGLYAYSSLVTDGTYLYGVTNYGGTNGFGTLYRVSIEGTGVTKLLDFAGVSNGRGPFGSLLAHGSLLYGMTAYGGANDKGTIFSIQPDGSGYVKLYDFDGDESGMNPFGSLISDGTYLYGLTAYGGKSDGGTIFKVLKDGSGFVKLYDFAGTANGRRPFGTLTRVRSVLFGMTDSGGELDMGTVFQILLDGSQFEMLFSFTGRDNGSYPYGSLHQIGTSLYGMTRTGGKSDYGAVFKYAVNVVGVEDSNIDRPSIVVQPNPFTHDTHVELGSPIVDGTVIVYDRIGQPVQRIEHVTGTSVAIHRNSLPVGMYLLHITLHPGVVLTKKVIIGE